MMMFAGQPLVPEGLVVFVPLGVREIVLRRFRCGAHAPHDVFLLLV